MSTACSQLRALMRQLADMQLKVPVVSKKGKESSAVAASHGPLYLQHTMILLADHGSAERMRLMGVTGLEESSAMGGGVPGILNLLSGHRLGLGRAAELAHVILASGLRPLLVA